MKSRLFSKLVDEACHSLKQQQKQKQKQKRNESSDSDSDNDSDGIDSCDDDMIETDSRFNLLNSSLCNTYSISSANRDKPDMEEEEEEEEEEDQHNNIPAEEGENPKEKKTCVSESKIPPPFASPTVIMAAASAARAVSMKKHRKHSGAVNSVKKHGKDSETGHASITIDEDEGVAPVMGSRSNANEKHVLPKSKESSTSKAVDLHIKKDGKDEKTPMKKRPRQLEEQEKEITPSTAEAVRFSDLGGIDGILESLREIMFPLYNPGIYSWLGLQPMRGILLHGPPGCGKTKLANAIAYEAGLPFLKISGSEIVSGMSGANANLICWKFECHRRP